MSLREIALSLCSSEHPFWVVGAGWVAAGELLGKQQLMDDQGVTHPILVGQPVAGRFEVYNIEVAGLHTYFVGENRILVHNKAMKAIKPGVFKGEQYLDDLAEATLMKNPNKTYMMAHDAVLGKYKASQFAVYAEDVAKQVPELWDNGFKEFWELVKKDPQAADQAAMQLKELAEKRLLELRQQYVDEVAALKDFAFSARAAGADAETVARMLHAERRALGVKYKDLTPPDELARITQRNIKEYGDPLGPSIEWLLAHGKTWDQIIESASRAGGKDLGY